MHSASDIEREIREFLMTAAPHQRAAVERLKSSDVIWGPVDSLLVLGLTTHLEKTFAIKVAPKDFAPENLGTIDRLVAFVQRSAKSAQSDQK